MTINTLDDSKEAHQCKPQGRLLELRWQGDSSVAPACAADLLGRTQQKKLTLPILGYCTTDAAATAQVQVCQSLPTSQEPAAAQIPCGSMHCLQKLQQLLVAICAADIKVMMQI